MKSALTFRTLIYAGTVVIGCVALVIQVAWQKYLPFVVGSEARSITLVVTIFLLGLAVGYRYWGNVTERDHSRKAVLKMLGYIQLVIAGYAILAPHLFDWIRPLSYGARDWLVTDLVTASALLLPTFLMGASIPMLTAAVPENAREVSYCHSRIYGLTTLGAFAGTFIGGFYLVPTFGLPATLAIAAFANLAVALVFLTNRLAGSVQHAEQVPRIPTRFGTAGIYLFVLTTGAVTIGYGIIFMRILGLSAGSGPYIVPIVTGVGILGLAVGSLSIRGEGVTERQVFVQLFAVASLLGLIYLTVPYWGYWLGSIRAGLTTLETNHAAFLGLLSLFVALFLLPVAIPLGRLLPTGYALIDKTRSDYGKVCGRVYFVNTVGALLGAVGIGYAMLRFLDLESIFKLQIVLVLLLVAVLFVRSRRSAGALTAAVLAAGVTLLPSWDRELHYLGLFQAPTAQPFHFEGAFTLPESLAGGQRLFLADGPNATVAVFSKPALQGAGGAPLPPVTISVDGKSRGNTVYDYSNMILSGVLPYVYARGNGPLEAAVVGLGTGITSGVLAGSRDVKEVVSVEISEGVIEALPYFEDHNFGLSSSPKSTLIRTDAVRYLARTDRRFDVIASVPSNPWVVGVTRLFTPEYYELAGSRLAEGGAFYQSIQLYEVDDEVFAAIVENVLGEFPYVTMYLTGFEHVGIVASHEPLEAPHLTARFQEPFIQEVLAPMHLQDPALLAILEIFEADHLRTLPTESPRPPHRLRHPWLGYEAEKARFLARSVSPDALISPHVARHHAVDPERGEAFRAWAEQPALGPWIAACAPESRTRGAALVCDRAYALQGIYGRHLDPLTLEGLVDGLDAYARLRSEGYLEADLAFLEEARSLFLEKWTELPDPRRDEVAGRLVRELGAEWLWDRARAVAEAFRRAGAMSEAAFQEAQRDLQAARSYVDAWQFVRESRARFLAQPTRR